MIIMLIGGGLGNQMFQYALGRHLSIKNHQPLMLDHSRYTLVKPDAYNSIRNFGLNHFNIKAALINKNELSRYAKIKPNILTVILSKFGINFFRKAYYKNSYVKEPEKQYFSFDPKLLDYKYANVYLKGFWQSEKYFKDIRNVILRDFTVVTPPDEYNLSISQKIKNNNSVSVHFRRCDYTKNLIGTLPLDYYYQAIKYLTSKIDNPHFFIFSDDMAWVKNNFKIDFPGVYVENSLEKDYEDMRLMSQCQHHIIANSTFSWWGAWLATNPDKIVIAPEKYVQKIDLPNPDYYPESWVIIKNYNNLN